MTDKEMAEARATTFADINYNETDNYGTEKEIGYHAYYCGFLAGLRAGRPKWHKVADGDLPKDKEYVLVYTDLNNYYVAEKIQNHFMSKGWGFIPMSTVIAWCEIPKYTEE